MSRSRVEKYIPKAIDTIDNFFLQEIKKLYPQLAQKSIPSEYNGYISAFGASIMQSGLKPTLALFENKNADTKKDKEYLTKIILNILDEETKESSLLRYVINSKEDKNYLKQKILDISIAIKLSIRTFKLDKGEQNE